MCHRMDLLRALIRPLCGGAIGFAENAFMP
jgi:hypothetical protein